MPQTRTDQTDRAEILGHIDSIFRAFLRQDRETLRQTHSPDWVGFMGPSIGIERGIESYMHNAEKSLQNFRGTGYELLDTEIRIFGEVAIVFYVARYDYAAEDGTGHSIPLRSVDLYQRRPAGWIQIGSHITVIPSSGAWGEGTSSSGTT